MMRRVLDFTAWLGVALVVGALVAPWVRPELADFTTYAAWAGIACILVYAAGQWREILDYFRGRNAQYGALASAGVLIVIGLLVGVNYLSERRNVRWDLTENQQYSLSDQTVQLLDGLEAPVRFLVFDQEASFPRYRMRLSQYAYESPLVEVEYVDADRNPTRVRQYDVETYGTIIVEYQDRIEWVDSDTEQDLTNGLIRAITGAEKTVYFLAGHGERDTTSTDREGYASVTAALVRDNYASEPLVLAQVQTVPEDASVVVIAGPQTDLLESEADALSEYLSRGGHVMILLDPPDVENGVSFPLLSGLLQDWGIEPGNDVVVDVSGLGQLIGTDASVPVATSYPPHPITLGFNVMTGYPLARSMTPIAGGVNGRIANPLIETSSQSWAESNLGMLFDSGEIALEAETGDVPGPVSLGAAVSAPALAAEATEDQTETVSDEAATQGEDDVPPVVRESRLVALGDSDFAANYALGIQGNRDLFINAVNWLAQQENLIAIRPRLAADTRMTLTTGQFTLLRWLSLLLVPGAVLGAGIYIWSRRR